MNKATRTVLETIELNYMMYDARNRMLLDLGEFGLDYLDAKGIAYICFTDIGTMPEALESLHYGEGWIDVNWHYIAEQWQEIADKLLEEETTHDDAANAHRSVG